MSVSVPFGPGGAPPSSGGTSGYSGYDQGYSSSNYSSWEGSSSNQSVVDFFVRFLKMSRYAEDQFGNEDNYKIIEAVDKRAGKWGNTGIDYIDDPSMRALYVDAHNKSFGPTLKKSYEYGWSVVTTSRGKLGLAFNALDDYKSTYFPLRLEEKARFHTHRFYLGPTDTDYGASWRNPFTNGIVSATREYVVDPRGICSYKGTGFDMKKLTYGGSSNYVWEW